MTWSHKTFVGIKVEEVFGMDSKSGRVWIELAKQIYSEQKEFYRVIEHFSNGAPYLEGYPARISLTHASHLFAVASLPKTPEINLDSFNPRTAMGIDAESLHRDQVLKIRSKFLSDSEMKIVKENDTEENIKAWTAKEAIYKAAFTPGLDFCKDIEIIKLPTLKEDPLKGTESDLGEALLKLPDSISSQPLKMHLLSYVSYSCCVTIAFSSKCARFAKS